MTGPTSLPATQPLVLLAEDDACLARELADCFTRHSFRTQVAGSWPDLIGALKAARPDLLLLDKQLGRVDALARIAQLRQETAAHIIVLTGCGSAEDRIVGLELGADGFLDKPIGSRELVVRVRAALRRRRDAGPSSPAEWRSLPDAGGIETPDGRRLYLDQAHLAVLHLLIVARGQPLSRQKLMNVLGDGLPWEREKELTLVLRHLRRALSGMGARGALQTVRQRGFAFLPALRDVS